MERFHSHASSSSSSSRNTEKIPSVSPINNSSPADSEDLITLLQILLKRGGDSARRGSSEFVTTSVCSHNVNIVHRHKIHVRSLKAKNNSVFSVDSSQANSKCKDVIPGTRHQTLPDFSGPLISSLFPSKTFNLNNIIYFQRKS